jgi:hypothetical protein
MIVDGANRSESEEFHRGAGGKVYRTGKRSIDLNYTSGRSLEKKASFIAWTLIDLTSTLEKSCTSAQNIHWYQQLGLHILLSLLPAFIAIM